MLSNLKIAQKIYLSGFMQLLLIVAIGFIGITQMQKIGDALFDIAEEDIPLTNKLTLLAEHQLEQAILFEKALFKASLVDLGKESAAEEFSDLRAEIIKLNDKIEAELKQSSEFVAKAIEELHSEESKQKFRQVEKQLSLIETDFASLKIEVAELLDIVANGSLFNALKLVEKVEKHEHEIDQALVSLLNQVQEFTLESAVKAEEAEVIGLRRITIVFFAALFLGILIPIFVARSISRPINMLGNRLNEIANGDGDLTTTLDINSTDETGEVARVFDLFVNKLRNTIISVKTSVDALGTSSETAVGVMEETVNNVNKQYHETEAVAKAVTDMSETINSVAKTTVEAANIAEGVKQRVNEGFQLAGESQAIIQSLVSEVTNASDDIETLAAETDNIGQVLDTIRGIAEQTNLLALNAAIEAARAGDTGRGFAVVADEVRALAHRTQTSTGDIQELVERLQREAQNAVSSMRKGSEGAQQSLKKSNETARAFEDSSRAVHEISDLNNQIAMATEQQSLVANQINNSLINIKSIAEATSNGAKDTSQANQNIALNLVDVYSDLNQFQV